jgi:general L-amino acid transport system permease protein
MGLRVTRNALASSFNHDDQPGLSTAHMASSSSAFSFLYNRAFRSLVYQILLAIGLAIVVWYLYSNVNANLDRQGIATGWDFLHETSGFDIGESVIAYDSSDTYGRALWAGTLNTLRVAFFGIILATMLGVFMGVARVSGNWLLSTIASWYVEICRNIPVVLHVIFWGTLIHLLPHPRDAVTLFEGAYIMNRGVVLPFPVAHPAHPWMGVGLIVGITAAVLFNRWARRKRDLTGIRIATVWPTLFALLIPPVLIWLAFGAILEWEVPVLKGFNYRGGLQLSPEFFALLVGITVYTGAFIAEIVRSGIQSVPGGQIEAARALGLRAGFIMRYVTIPQALRVIVPPTASQYLSLTKNSSLGVLIGYPDLVNIGNTTLNQTGQAVEAIAVMMMIYLTISLVISAFMNLYNRLVAIQER